ncbi:MAG: helix-turn-helix transcriptional regulator [Chitinophagaceae bacterium]|nr:helix-turn-helix transcriptional regulator [Chitinophagaceae bacterium]
MRLLNTEITPLTNEFLCIELRHQQFLQSPYYSQPVFHAHPELELIYIVEGYGTRIIGDTIEPFEAGDMVFIGSNLPHVWLSDEAFYKKNTRLHSKAFVTYFNSNKFREVFESVKEFSSIREIIRQAGRGIKIFGETRKIIAEKLLVLSSRTGFEKIEGLLQIMHLISVSEEKSFIINKEIADNDSQYSDRLVKVIKFIKENLHNQISLKQVSAIACMTEQSFCRFFRNRTRKSFSQYLSDQRISHACTLLIQSDKSISEISDLCGYKSSSHFCKVFKDQINQSPYQYKRSLQRK